MPSDRAVELAAQVWCMEATRHIEMDVVLAGEFADLIDPLLAENERLRKALGELKEKAWKYDQLCS